MPQTVFLQRTKDGTPKRFAVRCGFSDKDKVKKAGLGTARWSKTEKVWTLPPDPVLLKQLMRVFPSLDIAPDIREHLQYLVNKQQKMYKATEIDAPLTEGGRLYPFQNASARVLEAGESVILGHSMGLGKTPIACSALELVNSEKVLIVCPSSVKWSWVDHLREWAGRTDLYVLEGSNIKSDIATVIFKSRGSHLYMLLNEMERYVLLMSYEMLRIHQDDFMSYDYDVIIFDEAHRLKNRDAGATQAALRVCERAHHKWLLTGTPVRNHYTDMFTLLSIVDPVRFGSYWNFVNTYLDTVPNMFGGVDIIGLRDEEEFNSMLSVYMYRLTKDEVLPGLPPKIYRNITIPLLPEQQKLYSEMEAEALVVFREMIDGGATLQQIVSAPNTVAQLIRLRQIALSPELIGGPAVSAKLDVIEDLIEDCMAEEEKVLVFSYFRGFIDLVGKLLTKMNVPYMEIVGGQTSKERYKAQQALTDGEVPIIIGTAQSMGEGMNLQAASTAIFCDLDWVPANNLQAEDRIHRGDIKKSPNIIRLYHPDTVEADVWATCLRKEGVIDETIGTAEVIRNMMLRRGE